MSNIEQGHAPLIVGIGEVLWDDLPGEGPQFGGAPANFACHCSQLGAHAVVVSAVGQDQLGHQAKQELLQKGVDTNYLHVDSHPTGVVNIELDAQGQPNYEIEEYVAWDHIPWNKALAKLAAKCDAVCFGTLGQRYPQSRHTIRQFLNATKPDCLKVFDINLRQPFYSGNLIQHSLEHANVLKLNETELPTVCSCYDIDASGIDAAQQLKERLQLQVIILTLGSQGSVILKDDQTSQLDAQPIEIVDTVGAGDAFTAATVTGLLKQKPLDQINQFASKLAAFVCQSAGANPTIPTSLLNEL